MTEHHEKSLTHQIYDWIISQSPEREFTGFDVAEDLKINIKLISSPLIWLEGKGLIESVGVVSTLEINGMDFFTKLYRFRHFVHLRFNRKPSPHTRCVLHRNQAGKLEEFRTGDI